MLAALAYSVMPLVDRLTLRWSIRDLTLRASLVANSIEGPLENFALANDSTAIQRFFAGITRDERLFAIGFCPAGATRAIATPTLPREVTCSNLDSLGKPENQILKQAQGPLLVSILTVGPPGQPLGKIAVLHDMSFVQRRTEETKRYLFYFFVGLGIVVSLITVVVAQLSWRGWVHGIQALMRGEGLLRPAQPMEQGELQPIADDLRALIRDLEAEHRLRDEEQLGWTSETLREILHRDLRDQDVIVVSNREPYIHVRQGTSIVVQRPASGLVTAMEPIMRACSGTWIAHGSGSADREVVDENDRIPVPNDNPSYQLRRVWLTTEEEQGYYYGFANEGLWPLCHIAHVRPTFRSSDWVQYERVNRKFADAVVSEARTSDPIVLVQDYHLALVPRMVRDRLPGATIITFWHIPWPNPEAFAICPWREELLDGMLGSSILGFHTQFHVNNFVDTVDRQLEARVDRETFSVSYKGQLTAVKRYPISIEWPPAPALLSRPIEECRKLIRDRHRLPADHSVGVGVERLDYTKGLEERFHAVERLMELHPNWVGRFTFIQIAAPTRASIPQYSDYERRVRQLAERINARFPGEHPAIILAAAHHEAQQVYEYYRASELCFVSSLHDGMNLVAKEFVAARDDELGVLILSQFTGAARELPEALIVNPYDSDQCAAALNVALTMPLRTQRARMRLMRNLVREFNVYRWAGRMLLDAARMRRHRGLLTRAPHTSKWTRASDSQPASASVENLR